VPFLIDTNVVIDARDGVQSVLTKLLEHEGAVLVSALSVAELQRGFHQDVPAAALRRLRLEKLLDNLPVVAFDKSAAEAYGVILATCGWARSRDFDRLIAAHAVSLGAILVTNNEADFRDIPNLKLENWAAGR
jgi:tRNA(fMet)-specific endonuclease VapC